MSLPIKNTPIKRKVFIIKTKSIVTTLAAIAMAPAVLFGSGVARANTTQGNQQTAKNLYSSTTKTSNTISSSSNTSNNSTPSKMSKLASLNSSSVMNNSLKLMGILRVGSRGQNVKTLQSFLNKQGLYKSAIDGIYGYRTQAAVKTFQRRHNLVADGVVGSRTENLINKMQVTS
ncbi:MAG: peptidoglycan-binding domain-containing protein [Scytonema sp. PMC 1070.18]|nr:peptidoglycan-binding domain-containing protein [Scytonema sp. PMC 1070.18]